MLPLIDIYRTANQLMTHYGEQAAEQAHDRAIDCLAMDDFEGYMVWQRVLTALENLLINQPSHNQMVH